nr:hypothetical protein [Tanacetum cinerariifolium]
MQKKKNDVKAMTTLLLSLPDEHQLRFSKYKTAKELWAAILKTFGGNEATKKRKKNLLKQQYGNFKAKGTETLKQTFNRLQVITFGGSEATNKTKKNLLMQQYENFRAEGSKTLEQTFTRLQVMSGETGVFRAEGSKTLEQTFTRLQVIVGQLQFMDVEVKQDDLNQKFLTSLAPEWLMHTIVWRNRSDLDTISLDDLYNHLKGNDEVNTTSSNVPTASANVATISISQETACAYIASQSSGGRRDNYRQGSKAEEQAPKSLMAIDGLGWDWSYMENDEEDHALVADEEAPTKFALMANTNTENKVFDNSLCSKDYKKNNDSLNILAQVESRLVEYKEIEVKYIEKIRTLEYYHESKKECIESLKKELEIPKQEKEVVDGKLAVLLTASKDLDNLIESQRSDK